MQCECCEKPMIPRITGNYPQPGQVVARGRGYCESCWNYVFKGTLPNHRRTEPFYCVGDCGRLLRPSRAPRTAFEGTIQEWVRGVCRHCHADGVSAVAPEVPANIQRERDKVAARIALKNKAKPVLCKGDCGQLVRPQGIPERALPGYPISVAKGMCRECYTIHTAPLPPGVASLMQQRRERLERRSRAEKHLIMTRNGVRWTG